MKKLAILLAVTFVISILILAGCQAPMSGNAKAIPSSAGVVVPGVQTADAANAKTIANGFVQ